MEKLLEEIEAAYDYRGHVTVNLKDGASMEGYVFNRQLASARLKEPPFIELYLKGSGEHRKLAVAQLSSIALTGDDCAAGKSYEDYLKKKAAEKKS